MILYIFLLIVTSVYSQQVAIYKERTSGRCGDSGGGWGYITSAAACGAGGAALVPSARFVTSENENFANSIYPSGCFILGSLYFNTDNTNVACKSYTKCVCTLTCPPGTYQDQSGQSSCEICASGTYSTVGASSCSYSSNTCPAGTYASGIAACTNCASGTYSTGGAAACVSCASDTYSTVGASSCSYSANTCPAGTYASGTAACDSCAIGTYSTVGASSCSYSDNTCPAGTYASGTAACDSCASDTYSTVGASSCSYSANTCPAGTYASGTAACDSCASGTYSTGGEAVCDSCPPGKYNDQTQRTAEADCKTCASGTVSMGGASRCLVEGCNYKAANNYNSSADIDDGSCTFGCRLSRVAGRPTSLENCSAVDLLKIKDLYQNNHTLDAVKNSLEGNITVLKAEKVALEAEKVAIEVEKVALVAEKLALEEVHTTFKNSPDDLRQAYIDLNQCL